MSRFPISPQHLHRTQAHVPLSNSARLRASRCYYGPVGFRLSAVDAVIRLWYSTTCVAVSGPSPPGTVACSCTSRPRRWLRLTLGAGDGRACGALPLNRAADRANVLAGLVIGIALGARNLRQAELLAWHHVGLVGNGASDSTLWRILGKIDDWVRMRIARAREGRSPSCSSQGPRISIRARWRPWSHQHVRENVGRR